MDDSSAAESKLLDAARRGDRDALGQLLGQHQQRVFGFGFKMCDDPPSE